MALELPKAALSVLPSPGPLLFFWLKWVLRVPWGGQHCGEGTTKLSQGSKNDQPHQQCLYEKARPCCLWILAAG